MTNLPTTLINYTFFGIDVFVTLESVKTKTNSMSLFAFNCICIVFALRLHCIALHCIALTFELHVGCIFEIAYMIYIFELFEIL